MALKSAAGRAAGNAGLQNQEPETKDKEEVTMLTFEELIVAHPLPWMRTPLSEGYKSLVIRDANDDSVCIRNTDETIVGAANLVGELRQNLAAVTKERDEFEEVAISHAKQLVDLKAKCERLEADRDGHVRSIELLTKRLDHLMTRRDCISHEVRLTNDETDRRRHEAACAIYAAWLSRGMFSCEPDAVAPTVIRHTDALLAELAKGRPDATAEPTPGVSLIEVLAGTKDDLIDADNYPAAAKVRDFMDWLAAGCPRLFNWPAFGIQDIPEAPVEAKEEFTLAKGTTTWIIHASSTNNVRQLLLDEYAVERIVKLLNGGQQ